MTIVSTEEPAQGQGPQEHDAVQHADAPEERQAKGEVRPTALTSRSVRSHLLPLLQFNLEFVSFQGSDAAAEEVPKAVWRPSEVGPEIAGIDRLIYL